MAWEWRQGRLVDRQTDDDVLVLADWFDVDQQDAPLIAAAPDILEALGRASAWLERWARHVGSCVGGEQCTCGLTAIRAETEAAIAHAQA